MAGSTERQFAIIGASLAFVLIGVEVFLVAKYIREARLLRQFAKKGEVCHVIAS